MSDPRSLRIKDLPDREGIPLPFVSLGDVATYLTWCADKKGREGQPEHEIALREAVQNMLCLELSHVFRQME